jgi:hypothetical protein
MKNTVFQKRGEAVGWAACREAACQRIKETLPKDLERHPFTVWIQRRQAYENIRFRSDADPLYLKTRIPKLWNPAASPLICFIATQSPGGEGRVRGAPCI